MDASDIASSSSTAVQQVDPLQRGTRTDGCIVASSSTLAGIFPRHHQGGSSGRVRPSLYHDSLRQGDTTEDAVLPPLQPLFTRRISWLPAPNVLHYVPASLVPGSPHLEAFTRWQSSPRVAEGWDQAWSMERQKQYIQDTQSSDSSLGLIGYWSDSEDSLGHMWGYIEIYWAKESNLKPFYDFPEHAMGLHALVGEEAFRGPSRVRAWMSSAVQMMYLLEPRCELVVSEPRATNRKMVAYECECGGQVEKEIQLPHKRAALVFWRKDRFNALWPLGDRPGLEPRLTAGKLDAKVLAAPATSATAAVA
ncbi:unnamed protein product [Parajaminaea phylloscopi]